ncbi:MAG: NADPH:quinone reductase [Steroidobacter sp.]
MRAALYERTGSPHEVLYISDVPAPAPGPGEVRIKMAWSGVNPSDVKSRAGARTRVLPFPRIIPHSDGAGVIDDVGSGVPRERIGERVWTWNAAWGRAFGTAAEYVALPASQAVVLPANVDLEVGACLGIPALTAYHAVNVDGGVSGKSVLVAGGAGAVGHYAIQIARLMGARQILSTVSSAEKAALAKAAGADIIVNYKIEDVAARVREQTGGRGVDRVIEVDFGANVGLDVQVVKREGEIVVYGSTAPEIAVPFVPMILNNVRLSFFIVYNLNEEDRRDALAGLTSMLASDTLTHNIAARLPFARIADAHALVENGQASGNVIVEIG